MRTTATAVALGCLIVGSTLRVASAQTEPVATAPSPTADAKVYGAYPAAYKQIINRWLETRLLDPTSAVIDWTDEPQPGEHTTPKGVRFVGYLVDFKVNARNQFGAPTGKQRYQVVIRDGEIAWGGRPRL